MSGEREGVERSAFGATPRGEQVERITLTNGGGLRVAILTYGGIVAELRVPDRDGNVADVVLGYDTLDEYLVNRFYFGALIGRNANRIAGGRLVIDGQEFQLPLNDPPNNLHGGPDGFHQAVWRAEPFERSRERGVVLQHSSAAGEDGYPGLVEARVTYTLTDEQELRIEYHATTDAPTPVNLTQHTYFNLAGQGVDALDHRITIAASAYTPIDDTLIPFGEHAPVDGTPFDLRGVVRLGDVMHEREPQLMLANGFDHNFVLDADAASMGTAAVRLADPASGRVLEIFTSEPGVQFYAGGTFEPGMTGKGGVEIPRYGGLALETQHFPDAPNQPSYPSTILRPGETFTSTTVWRFSVDEARAS